jgi:hypothetical protein
VLVKFLKRPKNLLGAAVGKLYNKTTHKGTIILTFREKRSKIIKRLQYRGNSTPAEKMALLLHHT